MLNIKDIIIRFIAGQIKKTQHTCVNLFQNQSLNIKLNINVKLYLSNYATKAYLKNATGVDTSSFAKNLIQLI